MRTAALLFYVLLALAGLGINIAIIYVIIHFVMRFW